MLRTVLILSVFFLPAASYGEVSNKSITELSQALYSCYSSRCLDQPASHIKIMCDGSQSGLKKTLESTKMTEACQDFMMTTMLHCEALACVPSTTTETAFHASVEACIKRFADKAQVACR